MELMKGYEMNNKLEWFVDFSGLSVSEFCNLAKISRQYYYDLINNRKIPTLEVAYRIVLVLAQYVECYDCSDNRFPLNVEHIWICGSLFNKRYGARFTHHKFTDS